MIDFNKIVSLVLNKLAEDEYFNDFKLISAFDTAQKPTVPKKPAVVCGIVQAQAQAAALGGDVQAGNVTVFADIYVPYNLRGFDFQPAAGRLFADLCGETPVSIGAQAVKADDYSECFVMRLTVTFSDAIIFNNN